MSSHLNVFNEGILDGATCHDRPQTFTQLVGWWDILSVVRGKRKVLCAHSNLFSHGFWHPPDILLANTQLVSFCM